MIPNNQNQKTPLLKVENLEVSFITPQGTARAVDGLSFFLKEGESLGMVGESGCGKSVTALSLLKLIPHPPGKITAGKILWESSNLVQYTESQMDKVRGKQISIIFQEPMTSLNPVFTVGFQISEMFRLQMGMSKKESLEKSIEMLQLVNIPAAEKRVNEYPHELSGGMRQRVMIAMALSCRPRLLIADEPTTALDVTIQAQILELMQKLRQQMGMALLLITHDLGIVANTVDRIAVMYAGKIVEEGDVLSIFDNPQHPYTRGLLRAIPRMDLGQERLFEITGTVPSLYRLPKGCNFYPRCTQHKERCKLEEPNMTPIDPCHSVSCWI